MIQSTRQTYSDENGVRSSLDRLPDPPFTLFPVLSNVELPPDGRPHPSLGNKAVSLSEDLSDVTGGAGGDPLRDASLGACSGEALIDRSTVSGQRK